jgi:pimeloyl-ACP methyl ester carboxylesterase
MRLILLVLVTLLQAAMAHAQSGDYAHDGNETQNYALDINVAPDYAREKRWAEEVTPGLVTGDAVYLQQKAGHKFLALYTEAKPARAAVILVHGLGMNPDWALIGTLRAGLADHGYTTLSLQMPVLVAGQLGEAYPALFPDAAERIAAAVAFIRNKGHRNVALVAHSMGARMSNFFLTGTPDNGIAAWVAIGISNGDFTNADKLRMPILDIYGERDLPLVLQKAAGRTVALKKLKGSAQVEVAGADHYFAGSGDELLKQVRQFLDRRFQ